jgi:hypothetical protein
MDRFGVCLALAFVLCGCKTTSRSVLSGESASTTNASAELGEWSWLAGPNSLDSTIASVTNTSELVLEIPKADPLVSKSIGWGKINTLLNFVPVNNSSYSVFGGALDSSVGTFTRRAKWGGWNFIFDPVSKAEIGWGDTITDGEVILPREAFLSAPSDAYADNSFEVEAFGTKFILIRIDPSKGEHLCFQRLGRLQIPTAGYIGTKITIAGKQLERKTDGWYSGWLKVSRSGGMTTTRQLFERAQLLPDSAGEGGSIKVLSKDITTDRPLYLGKNLEFPMANSDENEKPAKMEFVMSEGFIANNPAQPSGRDSAMVETPDGSRLAGSDNILYKINEEKRWGYLNWRE